MKHILTLVAFLVLVASCTTEKGANGWFDRHPDKDAERCAKNYPVRDSIAPPTIEYYPADNENYQGKIDSLVNRLGQAEASADDLAYQLARQQNNDSLGACKEVLKGYQATIADLKKQVGALKAAYKPCKPDTVERKTTIYRENTAKTAAQAAKIADLTASDSKHAKQATTRGWACIVLGLLLAGSVYLNIRKA